MGPFDSDIFTLQSLTAAINEVEYAPRRLGEMGLFSEEGIMTTSVVVEKSGRQLGLVPSRERGAPGQVIGADKRTGVTFTAVHLPTVATILADEVQNVRAFGSEDQTQAMQNVVNTRLAKMAQRLEVTTEFHRVGAVRGQILDADATTVLVDLYSAFGITQTSVNMVLDTATTKVQEKCLDVLEAIEVGLGDMPFTGVTVMCGSSFWRKLIGHAKVEEAYKYQQSERLRADGRESFSFGGLNFERYRGGVGGTPFIPATVAYAVPMGAPDMFISRFAPANYADTVNTIGLPMYASTDELGHNKGVELEGQSNPIHLNTRPQAVIKLNEHNG
jgi:hypothetical protein